MTGYAFTLCPGHPAANSSGSVRTHILVAEAALGRPLPPGTQIHHINGDRKDNRPQNLVVCQDDAYHKLLHVRQRALREAGSVHACRCYFCKQWGPPDEVLALRPGQNTGRHKKCASDAARARLRAKRVA